MSTLAAMGALAFALVLALRPQPQRGAPRRSAHEWMQLVAEARIARQLETADAIDAKGGVLFAYGGVLLVAAPTLSAHYTWHMGATLALALITIVATTLIALWPQKYADPPDAQKLDRSLQDARYTADGILRSLKDQQLAAIDKNEGLLMFKARALKLAVIAAVLGTTTLALEAALARGVM